jgi:hypothetical protein
MIKTLVLTVALLFGNHHGGPIKVPITHAINYKLHPCAVRHPPINPDWGACQGTKFIAS